MPVLAERRLLSTCLIVFPQITPCTNMSDMHLYRHYTINSLLIISLTDHHKQAC